MTDTPVIEDIYCPVSDCDYRPPEHLSQPGKMQALKGHIQRSHSIADLPKVTNTSPTKAEMETPSTVNETPTVETTTPKEEPKETGQRVAVAQRPAKVEQTKPSALSNISPIDPKKERIEDRTQRWGSQLYDDFNPMLVNGVQKFIDAPDDWMDNQVASFQTPDGKTVTFWQPVLREQLTLSEKDCNRLARAGANFAESPMGQAFVAWMEHNQHWVAMGVALYAVGSYGWKLARIRTEIGQLKEVVKQQQQMAQPQTAESEAA